MVSSLRLNIDVHVLAFSQDSSLNEYDYDDDDDDDVFSTRMK